MIYSLFNTYSLFYQITYTHHQLNLIFLRGRFISRPMLSPTACKPCSCSLNRFSSFSWSSALRPKMGSSPSCPQSMPHWWVKVFSLLSPLSIFSLVVSMNLSMRSRMRSPSSGLVLKETASVNLSSLSCSSNNHPSSWPEMRQKYLCYPATLNSPSPSPCLSEGEVLSFPIGLLLPQKQHVMHSVPSSCWETYHPNILSTKVILKSSKPISQRESTFLSRNRLGPTKESSDFLSIRGKLLVGDLLRSISAEMSSMARQSSSLEGRLSSSLPQMQFSSCCLSSGSRLSGVDLSSSVRSILLRQMWHSMACRARGRKPAEASRQGSSCGCGEYAQRGN